jgi:nucleoside-diphosphate-sugar epimerase
VRRSVLDNNRARAVLGWAPRTSLEEGLALTVQSMRR